MDDFNRYDLIVFDWNGTLSRGLLPAAEKTPQQGLFPGVLDLLRRLRARGIKLAIATAASRFEMEYEIETHGLEGFFEAVYTLTEGPTKPDPFALIEAMRQCGVLPERTLMVGDTRRDIFMAKNAGVSAIGVDYGLHHEKILRDAGAIHVVSELKQLLEWVE
jgi:phosphoglycolate phosphatase